MLIPQIVAVAVAAQLGTATALVRADGLPAAALAWAEWKGPVSFKKREREVTNWRFEAISRIDAPPAVALAAFAGRPPPNLPRCIKLNNYWCIKRAGWAGEIASDNEGHVAFASASEGAQTAALLLRRYYVDFGRHSAYAIVSRWAPAQCGYAVQIARTVRPARPGRSKPKVVAHVARSGLGNTLRARWLAAHGGRVGAVGRAAPIRASVVPDYSLVMIRAPSIEAGVAEIPASTASFSIANLAALEPTPRPALDKPRPGTSAPNPSFAPAPVFSCAAETQRINNYAVRASAGITPNINDDLQLFTPDGNPLPNLAKIMYNMSSVEIGPWKVDRGLIQVAIAKANEARIALLASRNAARLAARADALRKPDGSGGPNPSHSQPAAGPATRPDSTHRKAAAPPRDAAVEHPAAVR